MNPVSRHAALAALGLAVAISSPHAVAVPRYQDSSAPVEARVQDLLGRLTPEEKISLLGGDRDFYIRAIPRLGIPEIKMADGPLGVRNYGPSTAFPGTVCLAAAWDPGLAKEFGAAVGHDARARGVSIMLAPAVNIARVPVNGRNFEYLSEDPYLNGVLAASIVIGIQSQGVVATVKHFAANNEEVDRDTVDVRVDERVLREIYLPAFRAAVEQGHAWAVMDAYNRLNGPYCTADSWLNNTVLKGEWKFQGVVMSDWGAAHDTLGVATGGLDLEMPSAQFLTPGKLQPLLASGQVSQDTIDDKVRRILRLEIANGFLDHSLDPTGFKDDTKSSAVALKIAREGVVLLKNDYAALPLAAKKLKRLVVLGPNATLFPAGGGSGHVEPFHYASVVDGLRKLASKARMEVIAGPGPEMMAQLFTQSRYEGPLALKFMTGDWGHMQTIAETTTPGVMLNWREGPPAKGVKQDDYWAQWRGTIKAPETGTYVFLVQNHGNVGVNLDGKQIVGSWANPGDTLYAEVPLTAGSSHSFEVNVRYDNRGNPDVEFAWGLLPPALSPSDEAKVKAADAVIICAGFSEMSEGEGADRPYELPNGQADLIRRAAALNPRTIVVLNSGGSLATADWVAKVPAVLQAWYPGQEGGRAVAEVLLGITNPSGKLPVTFEQRWEDTASFGHYPGKDGKVDYAEGLLVGYRWFDAKGLVPLFPFGHGLSYTSFHYEKMHVEPRGDGTWAINFDLTNIGTVPGDEVTQLYVSAPVTSRVKRAVRELKAFSRVGLKTEQTTTETIILDRHAFEYYDTSKHAWAVEPGTYTVEVGSSERKIMLSSQVDVD